MDAVHDAFPTCVGMNRPADRTTSYHARVPYMCGDEPAVF